MVRVAQMTSSVPNRERALRRTERQRVRSTTDTRSPHAKVDCLDHRYSHFAIVDSLFERKSYDPVSAESPLGKGSRPGSGGLHYRYDRLAP
jgi:hypothetical protein